MSAWPRGSNIRALRISSAFSFSHARRLTMVSPGRRGRPLVTMRNASPPVWTSTVEMVREIFMFASLKLLGLVLLLAVRNRQTILDGVDGGRRTLEVTILV